MEITETPAKIGTRVLAIARTDSARAYIYGRGRYLGRAPVPDGAPTFFGPARGLTSDCIELDGGQLVWGCQCLWAPEVEALAMIGAKELVTVRLGSERIRLCPDCERPESSANPIKMRAGRFGCFECWKEKVKCR